MKNDPTRKETRGRKSIVSPGEILEMGRILENEGLAGRALTWKQLGWNWTYLRLQLGEKWAQWIITNALPVSGAGNHQKAPQIEYNTQKSCYNPEPEDWDRVRFSDEVHFDRGAQRYLRVFCKPGERYCIGCIQHTEEPKAKDDKRFHCWAASGYNFKSDITFSDVSGNSNGRISLQVYIDQILSLLLSNGCWKGMTLHWKKLEIVDMARPKTTTLFEDGKKETS